MFAYQTARDQCAPEVRAVPAARRRNSTRRMAEVRREPRRNSFRGLQETECVILAARARIPTIPSSSPQRPAVRSIGVHRWFHYSAWRAIGYTEQAEWNHRCTPMDRAAGRLVGHPLDFELQLAEIEQQADAKGYRLQIIDRLCRGRAPQCLRWFQCHYNGARDQFSQ